MHTGISQPPHPSDRRLWQQVLARDRNAEFVYAVRTTGIFCRPSCTSRRPAASNVMFFSHGSEAVAAGYRACLRCNPLGKSSEAVLVARLCRDIARRRDRTFTLAELGSLAGMSPFTVQRLFKRVMGVSPKEYQAHLRAAAARGGLLNGVEVTEAIYGAGYSSSSRFYDRTAETLGMSPTRFRNGGRGERIRFATADSPLGLLLVAATGRGLCSVMLGEERTALERELRRRFHEAEIVFDAAELKEQVAGVLAQITDHPASRDLPLDVRATSFQARVWQALRKIPRGQTRSYAEVAGTLGQPRAVRAVARACASNPVAIAIPCHRVIGSDGALTGYRWGIERKKKLLEIERS